ncbi:MAG TPA: hypothetical protein VFC72_07560, partial [Corynebacterium sp.]|nr:hypothetical protein [Corynebacterium sp.]
VPVLTPRGGEPVQLEPGEQTIGGAVVDVDFNDNVPGVVDITMDRSADWAGEWAFGYQDPADENLSYRAQLTIHPGMSLLVSSEDSDPNGGLRSTNTSPLTVQIIDSAGDPQPLAGEATLSATFRSNGTGELNLARDIPAGAGQAVDVPLAQIEQPSSGTLSLRVDITTEGPEGGAGTDLDPLMFESPLSVTLESLPQLPPNIDLGQISEETITVEVPVTGPGRVWVEAMPLAEASLPDGIALTVSSSADSFEDAVVLEQDEDGVVPLTVQSTGLADGPVTGALTVHYADLEDTYRGSSEVPVRGAMRVPVDGVAFTATFFGALLLALLIPLGVLYLMKYITGRIPTKPRLNVVRVPVTLDQGTLRRTDTDAPFEVEYRELGSRPALEPDPRSLQMPGAALQVKLGWNPFQPAYAEADADLSIADDGRRAGSRARLPVVVHNRWFMMLEPEPTAKAYVYLLVDETSSAENLKSMVSEVQARGPERFRQLRQDQIRQNEDLNAALAPEPVAATSMAPAFGRRPEAPSTSPSSPRPGSAAPPTSDETPTDPFAKGKKNAQSPSQSQGQFGKFGHFGGGQFGKFGQFGGGDFPGNGAGPNTDPFHKGPEHPQSGAGENPGGRPSR